ncbi:hypothetical protein A5686_18920 [Mycobacterium sp. E2479]|nr:hypothetical protein A5686_18920 [Mycobacterium sp. E2479]
MNTFSTWHVPFAPRPLKIYCGGLLVLTLFTLVPTIGMEVGFIKPTFTVDVLGNIVLALPSWLVPLVAGGTVRGSTAHRCNGAPN